MSGRSTSKFNKIISYLSQKLIDTETQGKQIFDSGENNLPENIDSFDISLERELGLRSTLKTSGNIYRMVQGADNDKLRCWIKFRNAARLYDYSRNGLKSFVYGLGQIPILNMKSVSDNVLGYEFQSFFNGADQYAYTDDHTKIRISDMFSDSGISHISFYDSFTPVSIAHKVNTDNSVLFEKIDDDQLKDGYAATITDKGDLVFYVRRNFKQYSLFLKGIYADQLADEIANGGNYLANNYSDRNYHTDLAYTTNLICSTVKTDDHWFVFNKATNGIKYILNGVDLTQTPFTVSPLIDVPFQDGAYNTDGTDRSTIHDISGNNYNGTLYFPQNGQWKTDNTFFSFGSPAIESGTGPVVEFPVISSFNSANEYTISIMYKPDNAVNPSSIARYIWSKNYFIGTPGNGIVLYRNPNSTGLTAEFTDNNTVFKDVTVTNQLKINEWNSIIVKFKANEAIELIVNGVSHLGNVLPSDITVPTTLRVFEDYAAARGSICYLKVWTTKIGSTDTQRIIDEGYHNPTFPKAEKPQPEPVEDPDPITNPFEVFYNLAPIDLPNTTVFLNSISGDSPFTEFYNVANGVDESYPETLVYNIADGTGGAGSPFVVIQGPGTVGTTLESSDPSNGILGDVSSGNKKIAVRIKDITSGIGLNLKGKTLTKAQFDLKRIGTVVGTVYCKIWNDTGAEVATLGSVDASTLPTTYTLTTFQNTSNAVAIPNSTSALNWRIGVEYTTGDSGDEVDVRRKSSNLDSSVNQDSWDFDGSSWTSNGNDSFEVKCNLFTGLGTTSSDPNVIMKLGSYNRVTQALGSGDALLLQSIGKVTLRLKKVGSPTGTATIGIMNTAGTGFLKATLGTIDVSTLSTTTTDYTFSNYTHGYIIGLTDRIGIMWTPSATGEVHVMTNLGNTSGNSWNGTNSSVFNYISSWAASSSIDLAAKIYTGGNNFDSTAQFTPTITRHYIKGTSLSSSVVGKALTKGIVSAKRTGTPTGLMSCVVRINGSDLQRFNLGTVDVSTISNSSFTDVVFSNVFNTQTIGTNDRICFEYLGATSTDYIELKINKDVFETLNTIGGSYSSPSYTDNAQIDLSGKLYTGGVPDVNSRIRVGQKIIVDNVSIMDGEKLTKIKVRLWNPNGAIGNISCVVFRGSDDSPIVTIGDPVAASTIGTSYQDVTFENTNNGYVFNVNDKVCIVFEGGDTSHQIGVHVRQSTGYDGNNSHLVRYNGQTYDDMEEWDLVATMWTGGDTYQPPPFAIPDPTPTNIKALLYCAGNNILSGFARVLQREFGIWAEDTTEEEAMNKYVNRYSKTSRSSQEVLVAGLYRPY